MAITTKLSGRKGGRSGEIGFSFVGLDKLTRALSPAGVPRSIEGVVSFNTPYALAQHERLDYEHPKGGNAKYLEGPLKENAGRYADHVGDRIRQAANTPIEGRAADVTQGAIRGITDVTEDLLGRAMREAPLDEGTLRASGTATVYVNGKRVSGGVSPLSATTPESPT